MTMPNADRTARGPELPNADELRPGQRVRVTKRLRFQQSVHLVAVEGRLLELRQVRTESSFAGSTDGRRHISELLLEKADGERSVMVVDPYTRVEVLCEAGTDVGSA